MFGAFVLVLAGQTPQIKSISVFEGGTPLEYVRWLLGNRQFSKPLIAMQEGVLKSFGPSRVLRFEDETSRVEPGLPPGYVFEVKGGYTSFHATFLPKPLINGAGTTLVDYEDRVTINQPVMTKTDAPRFEGSLSLKNQLAPLGWNVKVHPFFSDMRVYVRNFGSVGKYVFEQIAYCVGGTATFGGSLPNSVSIEPNLPEIRKRALVSIDFYNPPTAPQHFYARAMLARKLYDVTPDDLFKSWLAIEKYGKPIDIEGSTFEKEIKAYRKLFFDYMESQKKTLFMGQSRRFLEAQRIYIVFQNNLCFDLRVQMENGSDLHF